MREINRKYVGARLTIPVFTVNGSINSFFLNTEAIKFCGIDETKGLKFLADDNANEMFFKVVARSKETFNPYTRLTKFVSKDLMIEFINVLELDATIKHRFKIIRVEENKYRLLRI